jgi:hypothetical protein
MNPHVKYIIAGGACCGEGGPFLIMGIEFGWIGKLLDLSFFPPALIWTFIIIGTASLIVGGTLLLIGLMKYRKQNQLLYEKI